MNILGLLKLTVISRSFIVIGLLTVKYMSDFFPLSGPLKLTVGTRSFIVTGQLPIVK